MLVTKKFKQFVFIKRSDVKKIQLEGVHTFFFLAFFPFFFSFSLFYPKAGIQGEFGLLSAAVIGQWVHMRTLGHEVVQSNGANQREEMGWVEGGREEGKVKRESWHHHQTGI